MGGLPDPGMIPSDRQIQFSFLRTIKHILRQFFFPWLILMNKSLCCSSGELLVPGEFLYLLNIVMIT